MIKIYSGEKMICFNNNDLFDKDDNRQALNLIGAFRKKDNEVLFKDVINGTLFSKNPALNPDRICFVDKDPKKLFKQFKSNFRYIEASGGLVRNEKDEYLFIFRNGKWDLPKGKKEKGETIKNCALREVKEECGIKGLKIEKELSDTYHIYSLEEKYILKRTFWFEMKCKSDCELIPQKEEGITKIKWVKKKDFNKVLNNTYPLIMDVIKEGVKIKK